MEITKQQKNKLRQHLDIFNEKSEVFNKNVSLPYKDFDECRSDAIPEFKEMVSEFLSKKISLPELKEKSNRLALDFNFWGFTGMSGQMQLNQYSNQFSNTKDGADILRNAISVPKDKKEAKEKINDFGKYLRDIRLSAETTRGLPWDKQAFLLSYFWEMQKPEKFPIYYKASRDILSELGFNLENHDTYGDEYIAFVNIIEDLDTFFTELGTRDEHSLWFVEHVLWYSKWKKTSNPKLITKKTSKSQKSSELEDITFAPSSWLPPIISDLSELAHNKETEWSKERNVRPEKAFETKLRYVFTLLGYDVTELGQGKGREPDGVARSSQAQNGYYAVVYDAKARGDDYSVGTDDRSIIEYIQKKKQELKKQRISKMYFVLISSEFNNSQATTDVVRSIYKTTHVPVILLRADDLLFITEEKLKNVEIDHILLEDLFLEFGLLTRDKILNVLGA